MKRIIITLFAALFAATALWAQTPDEILARMDKEVARFDKEGVNMIMDIKIPLLGTYSTDMHILGDMYKATLRVKDEMSITWSDGITTWDYDSSDNELTISPAKPKEETDAQSNMEMLDSVTEGYDVKLKKETAEAWEFVCTRSKTNPNKDDPKKMNLVISKTTYLPISVSVSEKGVRITMRDFVIGVNEEQIRFDPSKYQNAKIVDLR
jgi:hypothetical protein